MASAFNALTPASSKDWHRLLYIDNAAVYQPVLEAGLATAPAEATGLVKIFERHSVVVDSARRRKVLDVSCGIGRHSVNLAKRDCEVVGFDFSPYFLRTARGLAKKERLTNKEVRFYEGDTSRITDVLKSHGESEFDAIICMDTSLNRPEINDERALLRSLFRLGRPGCLLVIETASRDFAQRRPARIPIVQTFSNGRLQRHLQATYDERSKHIVGSWKFYRVLRNGDLKHLLSVNIETNIHAEADLRGLIEEAGWEHVRTYSDVRKLGELTPDSFHIVMVAKKR